MSIKEFKITEEQAQAILNYLATCPYGQVYQLVAILMNLEEQKDVKHSK
jgi:hypothetical protein